MKRLLLLTAIFLAGCTGLIELVTSSSIKTIKLMKSGEVEQEEFYFLC